MMNKEIILNKKNEKNVKAKIKYLDVSYIDKIIELEKNIYEMLENKEFYSCSSKEEYSNIILKYGKIIGCVLEETDELVCIGVYASYGYNEHNYGYDFNIEGEELLKVSQIESTIVSPKYRGNGLQNIICNAIEELAKENGDKMIAAKVATQNIYSLNTFIKREYKIMADKLKYGGLRRYVVMKEI